MEADVDEVFWLLKIWLALKALRGSRDDCAVWFWEEDRDVGGIGKGG